MTQNDKINILSLEEKIKVFMRHTKDCSDCSGLMYFGECEECIKKYLESEVKE